jgi:hypothetical protein
MKCRFWPLIALLLASCSKHIPVDSDGVRDEINNRAAGKRATVILVDGSRLRGQRVELSRHGLISQGRGPSGHRTIPLDSLGRLEFRYHLKGAGYGLLAGAGLAGVMRLPDHLDGDAQEGSGFLVFNDTAESVILMSTFGVVGAAGGLLTGYTVSYRFRDEVQPAFEPCREPWEP